MAIVSIGYNGTVDEVQWAKLHPAASSRPSVVAGGTPSIVAGVDRTMRVGAGEFYGWGVHVASDGNVDVQGATVASGTRWDTLVLRRDWSTNTSTFMALSGTSTKAVSAALQSTPGVVADQVIGLFRVDAGQAAVQEFFDMREWHYSPFVRGAGVNEWPDANLHNYAQTIYQTDGLSLDVGVRRGAAPSAYWEKLLARPWVPLTLSGSVSAQTPVFYRVVGDVLELRGSVRKVDLSAFSTSFTDVATLSAAYRPVVTQNFAVAAEGVGASSFLAAVEVRGSGSTSPGLIRVRTSGTNVTAASLDGIRVALGDPAA